MDIRAQRTMTMLAEAFGELAEEKPLGDITVTELCALSTVRRATFYRHFTDIRDFTKYYFSTMTDQFTAELSRESELEDLVPYAVAMHERLLRHADEHRALFRHAFAADMLADTMDMIVVQVADGIVARIHAAQDAGMAACDVSAESAGLYYAAGLVHAMRWRILGDEHESVEHEVRTGIRILTRMLGVEDGG